MTEAIETTIYNLIQEQVRNLPIDNPDLFVLINPIEIDILKENNIEIKNISYHYYDKYNTYRHSDVFKKYQEKNYPGKIYLLGTGPMSSYFLKDLKDVTNIIIEWNFNSLKYLSDYSDELIVKRLKGIDYDESAEEKMNKEFVELLKKEYKKSLFYCPYNTGILGIEGYFEFHKDFYEHVSTVDNIYIINTTYSRCEFIRWLMNSKYKDKVKLIDVCVAKIYQTNPELIAYYRIKKDNCRYNFFEDYKIRYNSFNYIDNDIMIGTDSYRHIGYNKRYSSVKEEKKWFPDEDISHIINVSDELLQDWEVPFESVIYEHYPISEREKDNNITKIMLTKAANRIHELVTLKNETNSTKRIYVHCSLGKNRSPAAVLFYLIKYKGMSLYDAYKYIATKRAIFTSIELFNILYEEALTTDKDIISPLKLRTYYAWNFCEPTAFMFSLYDMLELDKLYLN